MWANVLGDGMYNYPLLSFFLGREGGRATHDIATVILRHLLAHAHAHAHAHIEVLTPPPRIRSRVTNKRVYRRV